MTRNQIEYQKHLETKRSNRAHEALEGERNDETKRHNYATEGIDRDKLAETNRHNLIQEQLSQGELNESIRYHDIQAQDKDEELFLKAVDLTDNKLAASGYVYDKGKSYLMSDESNVGQLIQKAQKMIGESNIVKSVKQIIDSAGDAFTFINPFNPYEDRAAALAEIMYDMQPKWNGKTVDQLLVEAKNKKKKEKN